MSLIDRRRGFVLISLVTWAASGCFSGPAGPAAPNKPANPEPPPKVEIPKGKNELPKNAIGRPID